MHSLCFSLSRSGHCSYLALQLGQYLLLGGSADGINGVPPQVSALGDDGQVVLVAVAVVLLAIFANQVADVVFHLGRNDVLRYVDMREVCVWDFCAHGNKCKHVPG